MPSLSLLTGAVKQPVCSRAAEHSKQAASCNHGITATSESEREDKALMKKLALGDSSALDKLYRKHWQSLEAFARGKLRSDNKKPSAETVSNSALLTLTQAAQYAICTPRYLQNQIRAGRLKALKPTGKLLRIRRSDLDAFFEAGATIGGAA